MDSLSDTTVSTSSTSPDEPMGPATKSPPFNYLQMPLQHLRDHAHHLDAQAVPVIREGSIEDAEEAHRRTYERGLVGQILAYRENSHRHG